MTFDEAFERLIGHEGGFQADPQDRGNWTTGVIGRGECKGTKFGVSAMSYPGEDIAGLTLERAKTIFLRDFWGPAGCDAVPDAIKFDLFDMAVNASVKAAVRALQHAVSETEDGILGPKTLQAAQSMPAQRMLPRFLAGRLVAFTAVDDARWLRFGRGWIKRVATNMMEA